MAERISNRTSSRRTTPQPAPEPARTTRATRSQSHDFSDSELARNRVKVRRSGKQTSSESADDAAGRTNSKGRKGRPANSSRNLQDLAVVQEDPIVYPEPHSDENMKGGQAEEDNNQALVHSKSPGGVSAFSGTTARTSRSAQDLSDLNSDDMLDALRDVSGASDKLLDFLIPSEISELSITALTTELQTKRSRTNKKLIRLSSSLSLQRGDTYGSDSYIAPREILRILLGRRHASDDLAGPWRPDALLQKVNLAVLASGILSRSWQDQDAQFVEELEHNFPTLFTEGFVLSGTPMVGYSSLLIETFELALEVRTQYAIMLLGRHEGQANFDWDDILGQVFFKDDKHLRDWDVVGLRPEDMTKETQDTILSRIEKLRRTFSNTSKDASNGIEHLQATFPWTTLVHNAVGWISQRHTELEHQIAGNGGIDVICNRLEDEVQRIRLAKTSIDDDGQNDDNPPIQLDFEPPSEASHNTSENQGVPKKSLKTRTLKLGQFSANSLKANRAARFLQQTEANRKAALPAEHFPLQHNQEMDTNIQVTATAGPSTRPLTPQREIGGSFVASSAPAKILDPEEANILHGIWRPQEEGNINDVIVQNPEPETLRNFGSQMFAMHAQREAENNKENIEGPISEAQPHSRSDRKRNLLDPQPNAQRVPFDDSEGSDQNHHRSQSQISSPSEDDGFQQSHISAEIASRRRLNLATKRPPPQPARSQGPSPKKVRIQDNGHASGLRGVEDRLDDGPSPSPLLDEFKAANSSAKERKAFQQKPPQTRRPWSDVETERLLILIEEHGTSWRLLKTEDEGQILSARDQVALKDKARNIKMDYLKAGRLLPINFDRIPINKIQVDRLRAAGIEYDVETGQRTDAIVEVDDE